MQVCLYGYKFYVENKLKKKQHKYVVVKGVEWWIIKEINCRGYLSLSHSLMIELQNIGLDNKQLKWVVAIRLGNLLWRLPIFLTH